MTFYFRILLSFNLFYFRLFILSICKLFTLLILMKKFNKIVLGIILYIKILSAKGNLPKIPPAISSMIWRSLKNEQMKSMQRQN